MRSQAPSRAQAVTARRNLNVASASAVQKKFQVEPLLLLLPVAYGIGRDTEGLSPLRGVSIGEGRGLAIFRSCESRPPGRALCQPEPQRPRSSPAFC